MSEHPRTPHPPAQASTPAPATAAPAAPAAEETAARPSQAEHVEHVEQTGQAEQAIRAEQLDRPEQAEQPSQAGPTTAAAATADSDSGAPAPAPATTATATATATETDGRRPPRTRKFPEGPAPDPAGSHFERRIRSFQPRRSRVTPGQADALRRLWPLWGFDIDGQRTLDPAAMFEGRPVVLEIGFGMGEATAQMAAADPDTGILAVDVHTPGQGNLLGLAERAGLRNLRVANGDAIILLRAMLPPASLDGLRVYFPDPWPKKRHHKRRLIQPEFLSLAAGVLKPGALLHCATDWEPYAEQMLEVLTAHPDYANTAPDGGYAPRPAFRPLTRFEGQGLDKGHRVHDLLFRRVER
ncbi:tRNA (guanine-N(7)-)-methyltransferase [Streptomyces albus]|uniref:tRNA (guanine-N(7)-)-methyltransferase n=1 Tax=Streptomyces albus (strain ATCC 21838 / DSM 41398 / FERM P-419 / JCM 4703 / NBRC 107858) TaxID=1081613 RepID=A0A0B5ENW6_STRA4|nr:tRNA (guanine-N(7)-)-methyltransferase [Streptomyces albus]AOU78686.1 tRNA (guanine-N(7)-)-methyltransferase [Streptomyces albus]